MSVSPFGDCPSCHVSWDLRPAIAGVESITGAMTHRTGKVSALLGLDDVRDDYDQIMWACPACSVQFTRDDLGIPNWSRKARSNAT